MTMQQDPWAPASNNITASQVSVGIFSFSLPCDMFILVRKKTLVRDLVFDSLSISCKAESIFELYSWN